MTRFLAILAALTCAASAQTFITVTADTNRVIRTNFTLGAAQVSGAFAISNITGLQAALDGKLATNGNASALTNFPTLLLTTNSSESAFPSALLRTNGDGSGLTNLPNANFSNATGVLPQTNGGTGLTNFASALTNLAGSSRLTIGSSAINTQNEGTAVGADAANYSIFGTAIGSEARVTNANYGTAVGYKATISGGQRSVAIGSETSVTATNAVQLGIGTNSTALSIQFQSAGTIDTDEWARLAALSTYPTTNISVVGTNNTNTLVFSNGILVEVQ